MVSGLITWSELRRAPLWRTVAEPLAAAVAGGCEAVVLGVPVLLLALPPIGIGLGFVMLRHRHPQRLQFGELPPTMS
jgi:hypothetical protein